MPPHTHTESRREQPAHTRSAAATAPRPAAVPGPAVPGSVPGTGGTHPALPALTQGRPAAPYTQRRLGARSAPPDLSPAALTSFPSCPLPQPLRRPVRRRGCRQHQHHPTGAAAVPREPRRGQPAGRAGRRRARVMDNVRCAVCAGRGAGAARQGQPPRFGFHGQLAAPGRAAGGTRLPSQTLWECQRRDARREPSGLPAVPLALPRSKGTARDPAQSFAAPSPFSFVPVVQL